MTTYKACFFDIDGTLYSHGYEDIPMSTQHALSVLKEKGWKLGIATSRCASETKQLPSFYRSFPFDAYVYDGGAHVLSQGKVVQDKPVPAGVMEELIKLQKQTGMDLRYSCAQGDYSHGRISDWYLDVFFHLYLNMPLEKPYAGEPVFNILIQSDRQDIDTLIEHAAQGCNMVHYNRVWELTAPGVEKGNGILALAKHWDMDIRDIVCFGDGLNDIEMLKTVGLGVAMGNGESQLKAAADVVCGHIDEDGISLFMKEQGWI